MNRLNSRSLLANKKVRFMLVGSLNTLVDFIFFFFLIHAGINIVLANIVSTSLGMAVSYTLNRLFTFSSLNKNHGRELAYFLAVTLVGLWLLQPVVIYAVESLGHEVVQSMLSTELLQSIGKVIATGFSLIWNYYWYDRVVFKHKKEM